MPIELPDLPYDVKALEPHISARTLEYHHAKHHRGYIDNLNRAIDGTSYAGRDLATIVSAAAASQDEDLFNNAAQAWNHAFLWRSMSPDGGGDPGGELGAMIDREFGSADDFRTAFADAATSEFGSGWAWLVAENGSLTVCSTTDAHTPIARGRHPLLTLDVWEHAYYLDFRNERDRYVDAFLEHLVNWEFAADRLAEA